MPFEPTTWSLHRNCAMTPAGFVSNLAALAGLCAITGGIFLVAGYPVITGFCLLQSGAVAGCGLYFAAHANDGEDVLLQDDVLELVVQQGLGQRLYRFQRCWIRIERGQRDTVWLASGRARIEIGRHVVAARRLAVLGEIASALRQPQRTSAASQ